MRIIRQASYRTMPWKNGGGETTEIATSPEGASLDSFDWRVSMARVASDGPFSLFPGVNRVLTVLEGAGIVLRPKARAPVTLALDTPPYSFPADLPIEAQLVDGPILDLNVMTRRGRARSFVSKFEISEPIDIAAAGNALLLLVRGGTTRLRVGAQTADLADGDSCVLSRAEGPVLFTPLGFFSLYTIDVWTGD